MKRRSVKLFEQLQGLVSESSCWLAESNPSCSLHGDGLAMDLIKYPSETFAMLRLALTRRNLTKIIDQMGPNKKFCYDILVNVSRSFAAVIMELQDELRDAVCTPHFGWLSDSAS